MESNKYENIIFTVQGGHGKCIMATSVVKSLKKKYPDSNIIVVSAWEYPFYYNKDVHRCYTFGQTPYFYENYIKGKEDRILICNAEPYSSNEYLLQDHHKMHLVNIWRKQYDLDIEDSVLPNITINDREMEITYDRLKPDSRPILYLQTNGGSPQHQYTNKSWARDIPISTAQELVKVLKKDFRIIHARTQEQPELNGVESVTLPLREQYALIKLSNKRLLIDSYSQHVAAALNLPSTVCWGVTKPEVFGYDMHDNILPSEKEIRSFDKYAFLERFEINGNPQQFPFNTINIFNANDIINSIYK